MLYKSIIADFNVGAKDICLICGARTFVKGPACQDCVANLPRTYSGKTTLDSIESIDSIWIPFRYSYPLDRLITEAKFHTNVAAMRVLAFLFETAIRSESLIEPEVLIPIPLHWLRLVRRGFNQSGLLADAAGRALQLPIAHKIGYRQKNTKPQATLGAAQRKENIQGAFRVQVINPSAAVCIIDDVVTTGATASAFAAALREIGYKRISLWALAQA